MPSGRGRALGSALLILSAQACSDNRQGVSIIGGESILDGDGAEPASAPGTAAGASTDLFGAEGAVASADGCVDHVFEAMARPAVLQIVLDTSGSMNWVPGTERTPRGAERSKWQATARALDQALALMPDTTAVGVSYYPNGSTGPDNCFNAQMAVPLAPLSTAQRRLVRLSNAGVMPVGTGTSLHAAYAFALDELEMSGLDGAKSVLLITDSVSTYTLDCGGNGRIPVDAAPLISAVASAFGGNMRTYVIGVPGSELARTELSRIAREGGTAREPCSDEAPPYCHFDLADAPDFAQALTDTLDLVMNATNGCDYMIPPPPAGLQLDLGTIAVAFENTAGNMATVRQDESADCAWGWQMSADQRSIHLCGAACRGVQAAAASAGESRLQVRFGCRLLPK